VSPDEPGFRDASLDSGMTKAEPEKTMTEFSEADKMRMMANSPEFGYPKIRTIDEQAKNSYVKIMDDDELRAISQKAADFSKDTSGEIERVHNAVKLYIYDSWQSAPDKLELNGGARQMAFGDDIEQSIGLARVREARNRIQSGLDDLGIMARPGDVDLEWTDKIAETITGGALSIGENVLIGAVPYLGGAAVGAKMYNAVLADAVMRDIDKYVEETGDSELKNFKIDKVKYAVNHANAMAQSAIEMSSMGAAGVVNRSNAMVKKLLGKEIKNAATRIGIKEGGKKSRLMVFSLILLILMQT
jgi:predicted 3-demethylubiquinone-9 3-methyltransferase (glyoxalase superfamily)